MFQVKYYFILILDSGGLFVSLSLRSLNEEGCAVASITSRICYTTMMILLCSCIRCRSIHWYIMLEFRFYIILPSVVVVFEQGGLCYYVCYFFLIRLWFINNNTSYTFKQQSRWLLMMMCAHHMILFLATDLTVGTTKPATDIVISSYNLDNAPHQQLQIGKAVLWYLLWIYNIKFFFLFTIMPTSPWSVWFYFWFSLDTVLSLCCHCPCLQPSQMLNRFYQGSSLKCHLHHIQVGG